MPVPTTLFGRMKTMLASTLGKETLARRFLVCIATDNTDVKIHHP